MSDLEAATLAIIAGACLLGAALAWVMASRCKPRSIVTDQEPDDTQPRVQR